MRNIFCASLHYEEMEILKECSSMVNGLPWFSVISLITQLYLIKKSLQYQVALDLVFLMKQKERNRKKQLCISNCEIRLRI